MVTSAEFSIPLWQQTPPHWDRMSDQAHPSLDITLREDAVPRPMVLIFPSGGYHHLDTEALTQISGDLQNMDCHTAVVRYRTQSNSGSPALGTAPILDAQQAFRTVRHFAAKWNVLPDSLIAIGFGAGAHLLASAAVHADWKSSESEDSLQHLSAAPNAMALGHPIISNQGTHKHAALERLLGASPDETLRSFYQLENRVTPATPRTFLWHTLEDPQNPADDSLRFAKALAAEQVDCELHVFNKGQHAFEWGEDASAVSQWKSLFLSWLGRTLPKLNQSKATSLNAKVL